MRLLVVEDSPRMQRALVKGLKQAGFAVDAASDGEEGLWRIVEESYDVVVLDVLLPKLDGLSVLRKVREQGNKTPILLLTVNRSVDDRVSGLRSGADDYLPKPFSFDELLARIEALARRAHGQESNVVKAGSLAVDLASRKVTVSGKEVSLTAREHRLLEYLALNKGKTLSRTQIERHVYDDDAAVLMSNVVDSAISAIRRKLKDAGAGNVIRTRRGLGYVLTIPG